MKISKERKTRRKKNEINTQKIKKTDEE